LRVADYSVKLFLQGWAPIIIFSGGIAHPGDLLQTPWKVSEAETFAERAVSLGVPKEKIIIENKSINTGQNLYFTARLLKEKGLDFKSFIAIQKPYMERRVYSAMRALWPDKEVIVTSPHISFEDYPTKEISKEDVIHIMVGDLQRIRIYPVKGWQIFQEIPEDVLKAYKELVRLGYTKHLLSED